MKRITAIALVLIMVLCLVSCASSGDGSVSGTYKLYALDYDEGHAVFADEFFSGENYVLLKDGGKAEMCLEDDVADATWKMSGDRITVTLDDGDMEGTLKDGILTLVSDGSNLYFVKDGASTEGIKAVTLDELLHGLVDEPNTSEGDELLHGLVDEPNTSEGSELQRKWNGWYYGCLDINGSEGGWEFANGLTFDAAMRVELDADGHGTLIIYDPYGAFVVNPDHNNRYVVIDCHADASYLYGDSGTAFDYDINTSDWIVVRNLDNQDKLNVGSSYTDENGNKLGYDFTFLPWGDRWEKETYQQFIPHFDEYLAKLDEGWTDPFGELSDPLGTDSGNSGGNAGGDRTGTKLDVNGRGILNVYYPAEQFEYDDTYGKLKNEATGVGILIDPMLGATNLAELKQSYKENNSDEDDYSLKETTLNGYKAIVMTYSDWLGATMRIDVDFGGNHDGWYGVSFAVSGDSLSDCDTDVVWSIINSMELVK